MGPQWDVVRLEEVLTQAKDPVPVDPSQQYPNFGIYSFGRGLFGKTPIDGQKTSAGTLYRVRTGQVVYSRLFAFEGAYGVVPPEFNGWYVSNEYPTFNCDPLRLSPDFLSLFLRRRHIWQEIAVGSKGLGDRRQRVQPAQVLRFKLALPPPAEQRRIVGRIEELSAGLREALGLRRKADRSTELLLILERNRVFTAVSSTHPAVRLDSMAECRLGKMLSTAAKSGRHNTPYLRNANVQWGRLDLSSVFEMDFDDTERREFELASGDILVCEGGDIGKSAIWNHEIPGCCFQKALHRVRVDVRRVLPRFMLHHIFWAAEQGHFADLKTQTTIAHLTGVKLRGYGVRIPPLTEQRRIVAHLDDLQAKVDALKTLQEKTGAELEALMPSILDRAFRGEL